jgi:uncharacterized oxidoreductase
MGAEGLQATTPADAPSEPRFSEAELVAMASAVLASVGTPSHIADEVARSLVLSNLLGHDSHGIVRLTGYAAAVKSGQYRAAAEPRLASSRQAVAVVDGAWGFGQLAAKLAAEVAIELSSSAGMAGVTITSCNHIGRVGEWVAMIAAAGKMGMALCNSGPIVAPFGGTGRVMGTNPFAWSVPLAGGDVTLDFATANIAEGKVQIARADGVTVPPASIIDKAGRPSVEPADLYDGGSLLPFGGHKGSGISVLIELSAALLSGMGASCAPDWKGGNGTLIMALDIAAFMPLETFHEQAEAFCKDLKRIGGGASGADVLVPGEKEQRTLALRRAGGVRVADKIRRDITVLADEHGAEIGSFALR